MIGSGRGKRRAPLSAVLIAAASAAGCLPAPATREGDAIANLYSIAMALGIGVAVVVWGLIAIAIVRFRRSDDRPDPPRQTHGHTLLEVIWTAIPLLMVAGLFALTLLTLNTVAGSGPAASPGAGGQSGEPAAELLELHVDAFRWGWRIEYPSAGVAVEGSGDPGPEAVLPVGRPVSVTLTAADVIHAWFVPQFLYKRDAIPGHPNTFQITIEQPGVYRGQCAEFCGLLHARMPFSIRAVSVDEFDAWLTAEQSRQAQPSGAPGAAP